MNELQIVVLDGYGANPGDLSWEILESIGKTTIYERTPVELVVERSSEADIILTNKVVVSAEHMTLLPKLKYIGVLATGYNVVDIAEAKRRGIVVTNIPSYSTDSVAQTVFAHILNITNRVDYYAQQNRNGRWNNSLDFTYWDTPLHELAGKIIGIYGYGNIGAVVGRIAHAFGMNVVAVTSKKPSQLPDYVKSVSFEQMLSCCDIVTLHCPLNVKTKGMINKQTIEIMKQGAILINTGRGPLIVEQDVAEALQCGKMSAYGADVLSAEPPRNGSPLLQQPNAFITPHIAWATVEARTRLMSIAINNIKAFIKGEPENVIH